MTASLLSLQVIKTKIIFLHMRTHFAAENYYIADNISCQQILKYNSPFQKHIRSLRTFVL